MNNLQSSPSQLRLFQASHPTVEEGDEIDPRPEILGNYLLNSLGR